MRRFFVVKIVKMCNVVQKFGKGVSKVCKRQKAKPY